MSDPERPHADPTLTLAELAGRMGLAKSTVSRALSGTGRVSAATRERVRREAERLGYQPDPLLSAFSRYRRKHTTFRGAVVALVLPDQQTFKPNLNNHWCEPRGYRVEQFFLSDFQGSQAKLTRVLRARSITGVIFPEAQTPIVVEPEIWRGFHAVYCGPYPGDPCPFDTVRHNPFDTVTLAWNRAAEAGYRRIGLILGLKPGAMTGSERKTLGGYLLLQNLAGPDHVRVPVFTRETPAILQDEKGIGRWIEAHRPDVILGFVRYLRETIHRACPRGREIPFIALRMPPSDTDGADSAGFRVGRLTIERLALRHLDGLIRSGDNHDGNPSRISLVIEPEWSPGASFPRFPDPA